MKNFPSMTSKTFSFQLRLRLIDLIRVQPNQQWMENQPNIEQVWKSNSRRKGRAQGQIRRCPSSKGMRNDDGHLIWSTDSDLL